MKKPSDSNLKRIKAKTIGGALSQPAVELAVSVDYFAENKIFFALNNYVEGKIHNPGAGEAYLPEYHIEDEKDARIAEGSINGIREPFGEAFTYATEILDKYANYYGERLFDGLVTLLLDKDTSIYKVAATSWMNQDRTISIKVGKDDFSFKTLSDRSIIYHEVGHAINYQGVFVDENFAAAFAEAWCDVFACFFVNQNVNSFDEIDWSIGTGYVYPSFGSDKVRSLDHPENDVPKSTTRVDQITPDMKRYQKGGFIRYFYHQLVKKLSATMAVREALSTAYDLFYDLRKNAFSKSMKLEDFAGDIYKLYNKFGHKDKIPERALVEAMDDVGLDPVVTYRFYNGGGYVARIQVVYIDQQGETHTIDSHQVSVGIPTDVQIPIVGSESCTIFVQIDLEGFKTFKLLFPESFKSQWIKSWGTIFSPQAEIFPFE
ncbi:zinc protease [Edwardsiella piscicida]|uniref:zinc protease n=1 Tax=Edwardsiella piscicida TaxID=1263550 RepID=UPI00290FA2F4|nr:zinc protease [Edwardsiella piscicida]